MLLKFIQFQKYTEALIIIETLAQNDPSNGDVKMYAGIVSLRVENYDKALLKRIKNGDIAVTKELCRK